MPDVLMCRPTHFDVTYDINPWMTNQIGSVDQIKAMAQWNLLLDSISRVATVRVIDGIKNLPDLVFTANAGFVTKRIAILSKFNKPERQPEELVFRQWFLNRGYSVMQPTCAYEGEGDHLVDRQGQHWLGTGFRTSVQAVREIETILKRKVSRLELVDPRWYHLDTCFCPLPNGELMWYPQAFSAASQARIIAAFTKRIEVTETDALAFACNSVCIGRNIFIPENSTTSAKLQKLGYSTHEVALNEFLKSGGAAKCLVLFLAK